VPGHFHQATLVDPVRKLMYSCTGRSSFAVYDLRTRKVKVCEAVESIPHNIAADDRGGVWSTHSPGRQAFFRYNPDRNSFEFPKGCAFPNAAAASNIMYPGAGPVDSIINGGDGYLYAASALGELHRLDPVKGSIEFLGKPFPGLRMPAMGVGPDGWLYMAGGRERASFLARYHREEKRFEVLGPVEAPDGRFLNYAHELCVVDGVCFIGETDNATRSGYMWACEL
jgi:streptogramin lyase